MEIKNRKLFKELVKKLTMELLDEESLEEITTTGNVAGYSTPFAFSSKKDRKKINQILYLPLLLNLFPNLEDEVQPNDLCYQYQLHLHNS